MHKTFRNNFHKFFSSPLIQLFSRKKYNLNLYGLLGLWMFAFVVVGFIYEVPFETKVIPGSYFTSSVNFPYFNDQAAYFTCYFLIYFSDQIV